MLINFLPQNNYTKRHTYMAPQNNSGFRLKTILLADTVSFCAKPPKFNNSFFMDALGRGYDSAESGLVVKAKEFHASLRKAVAKLKAFGFEYDEAYNSACPIKKKKSVLDKYERQGTAQDIIRGTVYWQDQQDISVFKKFLDAMREEGWEIVPLRKIDPDTGDFLRNKNGNIIKFPDLEIRQNGVSQESLSILGEFLQRAEISKPRSSTYSDWQMRFIKINDKGRKESRQDCEVIFLYGPHYKDAKEIEHKYVYEPVRKLKKLHVDMNPEHHPKDSAGHIIATNFGQIQKRLVQFISQPLFLNASITDLKLKDEKIPVEISRGYANLIMNYLRNISKILPSYYNQMSKELLTEEQIIGTIKNSSSYQFRSDKTISPKEIKDKRREIRERLAEWKQQDLEILPEIKQDIQETLNKFVAKD